MISIRLILKLLPWVLLLLSLLWISLSSSFQFNRSEGETEIYQSAILTQVEQIGKLELAKYNFQEVTEIKRVADVIDLKFYKFKVAQDSKAVLISQGSATGCIDLTKITAKDIKLQGDTLIVSLPQPEMCYFKIDLEKSRLYDLQINYLPPDQRNQFIQELYQVAEQDIKAAALQTGILEQTRESAERVLKPLFQNISGKTVILTTRLDTSIIQSDD